MGTVAEGDCVAFSLPKKQQESAPVCWEQFQEFLTEIGRDQGPLVVALYPPEQGPCIHVPCTAERLPTADIEQILKAKAADGLALGLVLNHPLPQPPDWGTKPEHLNSAGKPRKWGASDKHISNAIGIWTECDGGLSLEAQAGLPKLAGLPEPSLRVWTGSKSLHMYWLLAPGEVLEPSLFKQLQQRLAARLAEVAPDAKPDTSISNAARVMRVPGGLHPKTGERCTIHSCTGKRFTVAELLEMLPEPKPAAPRPAVGESIPLERLLCRELKRLAAQGAPEGSRNQDAFRLAVSAHAVADAAAADGLRVDGTPETVVLAFAARCSPPLPEPEALACLRSAQSQPREPDAGWPTRREYHRQQQQDKSASQPGKPQTAPPAQLQQRGFRPRPDTQARRGKRELSHTRRMACFDRCVEVQARRERNSLRRRARLLAIAKALGLSACISRQDISQRVLEAKDQQQGNHYQGLSAADRLAMEWPEVDWLVPSLLPANDLNIIGGRPKVGKTAMAMAIAAAVLKGEKVAGCMAPDNTRPVIVVSDDQGDADTKEALTQLGIFDHPALIWSRRFRLAESDLDQLLADVRRNPGALVIIDSLRSVSRALQQGENDPEIGTVIYDLKAAVMDAGGSVLLIHHCNKASGLTGVEALSGHNAIAGAANTVITLHYVENSKGQPDKEAEQRRMVREGRTGKPLDWVISRTAGTANFHQVGTYAQWLDQIEEASKQAKREARQTTTQVDVLDVLEAREGQWLTCREVVEALGLDWGERGNGKDPVRVREALNRLAQDGEIQRVRAGNQYTFAAAGQVDQPSHGTQLVSTTPTTSAPLQGNGSECRGQTSAPSAPGRPHGLAEVAETEPLQRNLLQRRAAEVVEVVEVVEATHTPGLPVEARRPIRTTSEWLELALAELRLAPHLRHLPEVVGWLKAAPAAPAISQKEVAAALERLHAADEQLDLLAEAEVA